MKLAQACKGVYSVVVASAGNIYSRIEWEIVRRVAAAGFRVVACFKCNSGFVVLDSGHVSLPLLPNTSLLTTKFLY